MLTPNDTPHNRTPSLFERLEDRVLFDGVPDATFILPEAESATIQPAQVAGAQSAVPTAPRELIFIDGGVENSEQLVQSLLESNSSSQFEIFYLQSDQDGIEQISNRLNETDVPYDAVHILSHGEAGNVELGSSTLTSNNINRYMSDLASWSNALTDDADILLYGCELAGNEEGQNLIQTISSVSGADVAASVDLTGDATAGGDWQLEFVTGRVQTLTLAAHNWNGTLMVEATDGAVTIQDAENSGAGTATLSNNGDPEVVTVLGTPTRVGQMLERVWTFNETVDLGRATFVFDVSGITGINATIASEFGLIISDQPDLADGPNTTTLVASGYDAANELVYFHQVDLNDGDFFGLATEVVQDNFSISPTATGQEDTAIDLGLTLSPSLTQGGQLQDIIATEAGFRDSTAGTATTDFFIPAGTTGIRITGFSTRDIGTTANDTFNDDYQFLNASIDLLSETSNGYIGHIIDQGPNRSDQFAFENAPLGASVLTGGGTIVGDANDNIDPTFTIVNGVLQITENHQLQTGYHVEFLTNATSSAEFIRTESAVLESGDQSLATLTTPAGADFLVVNITDAAAGASAQIEYKGNSRIYIDLTTLQASGVVAAEQGETDVRVVNYGFENYDVSGPGVGTILSAAGTVVGDTAGLASVINDNQIYIDGSGNLVINRNDDFAGAFNSLITVEYYDRRDFGSSAEQLGESSDYGFFDSDPSNPISTLEFDIPDNATLGIFNLTFNGTNNSDTNENSGAAFAVIDLANQTSSGSIYFVRASNIADLVGFDSVPFGTAFFDDPNSTSNHTTLNQFNDPFGGTAEFNLINGGSTLEFAANSDSGGTQSFLNYFAGAQVQWFGAAPFEISGFLSGGSFSQGTFNPTTGNWELTIADAQAGLAYIPPQHLSGTVPVDVTLRIGDESEVTAVTIQAVIDPISFAGIPDACGHEDTDISIAANVTPTFVDQDGSETVTNMVLTGIPVGHTLSDGINTFTATATNQSIDITAWNRAALTYRANPDESGTFTIGLDVDWQDVGGGVTDTDSFSTSFDVVVKPVNDPPIAVNDNYTVLGNTTLTVPLTTGLINNDSDQDGDPLTVTAATPLSGPSNGSLTFNPDGTFTYTPNTGFFGLDSFDYQISDGNGDFATATAFIDVSEPVIGPLDAINDAVTTNEETLINIAVMANDNLPTSGAFNIQSTTSPSNGSVTVLPNGTIDYTPNLDFFGTDTFTYTLADASGRTSTATVTVTVVNVNDPPAANADSGSTPEDITLPAINILANDTDPDMDTLTVTTAIAANGTVVINADGTIDYTPNLGFNGIDTVNYTISDGNGGTASSTVQINVVPVADPPTSADNSVTTDEEVPYAFSPSDFAFADQDPADSLVAVRIDTLPTDGQLLLNGNSVMAGQVISLSDLSGGNLLFVPDADENGTGYANFDFSVTDGVLFQTTPNTMTVNVNPIQDPPVATDNAITVPEESTGTPLGLAAPTDIDGDTLTATVTGLPTLGTVFLADGVTPVNNGDVLTTAQLTSLVYDAPTTFTTANAGSFTYDVTDGIDTDSGQVDITTTPVNDPPVIDLDGTTAGQDHTDTFVEGGAPRRFVDTTMSVTDEDDTFFPSLKIAINQSTIVDAGEEFLTINGIDFQLDAATDSMVTTTIGVLDYNISYTAVTGTFEFERADGSEMSATQIRAILIRTFYRNDSVLPTVGDRVFDVCVNDGDADSNLATSTISVTRDTETASFSISGPATVIDGNAATFVVELSDPLRDGETAFVDLALTNVDTNAADLGTLNAAVAAAVAGYAGPGALTWNGTTLSFTSDGTGTMAPVSIVLPTTTDGVFEGDEDFNISLANPGSSTGENITIDAADGDVTTTIIDNTPAPTLMIGDGSVIEGSPVVFELTLDLLSFDDITLELAAATGSATANTDFETTGFEFFDGTAWVPATNGTEVTIPAGQTSLMVRIDTVQETLVETDETFTLSANVISGAVTDASDTGTGTIINDDVAQISVNDVTVDEDNGTLTFTVSLDQPSAVGVTVDYATASGTGANGATSGVDFTATNGTLTFNPGVQTQTVTVSITNDNLFEGPHSFDINLTNPGGATILDGTGVGTIVDDGTGPNGSDDDRPVISIDNVTATEGTDPFAVFTVNLSSPSIQNTVLSLALADISAAQGTDYGPGLEFFDGAAWQPITGNVTIPAGATSLQVRTAIIDDPFADSGETYTLTVAHVSGATANTGDVGTGTILDDAIPDPTFVRITGPPSVTEGNSATYSVSIDNAPLTDVTVTFVYSGSANGGTDYTGVASVTIPAGSTIAMFTIPTIDDTLGEPLENFTITIDNLTGGSLEDLQIDPTDFEVTTDIIDDDVPKIAVNDVIVTEGFDAFAEFTVELSNPTFENIDFSLSASGVTADGETVDFGILGLDELQVFNGTAYVPATSATFAPGVTTIQLRTPIADDALAEPVETFTVTATVTGGTTCNPFDTGIGTIQDDATDPEVVLVSLTGPSSVVEGNTTSNYTLELDNGGVPINAAEDVTVTLTYAGIAADGTDFTGVATVLIPQGAGSATFTLPTVNDSLFEDSEDIIISIDAVSGGGFEGIAVDTMADTVVTTIIDDADIPTVSVNDVTSIEGTDSFAVYTIELSNLLVEDVDVNVSLAGVTATGGGVDFGAAAAGNLQVFNGAAWVDATTATIIAGQQFIQVRTPIVDDLIDEPTENYTLTVEVTAGTTTNIQVIGNGTILDDDPAPDVTIADGVATEGDQLVFSVSLSNPSSTDIVLDFAATDNTTSSAADYASTFEFSTDGGVTWLPAAGGSEVTIPASSTSVLVRTLTTEDPTLETTETFDLSIASVVSGLVGDTSDTATGTILDDDVALVSVVANDPSASEPNDDGQFTVSLTNPSDTPTVIAYTVSGSASGGGDYAALSGTVTIPVGATSALIDVSVIDDVVVEGNEDVIVTLTSITSGDAQISIDPANDTDNVTIADDDVLEWSLAGVLNVNEGALATYSLSHNATLQAGETATVEFSISDVTTTGADYASFSAAVAAAASSYAGPGSVTWDGTTLTFTSDGMGVMNPFQISLLAVNDAIVEGPENYTISITNSGSSTGATTAINPAANTITTTIHDTIDAVGTAFDKATFSLTGATSVNEASTTDYTITIDATLQAGENASVEIALANVDTTAGDITALNAAVTAAVTAYNANGQPGSVAWNGTALTFTSDGTGPMGNLVIQIEAIADGFLEGPEDYTLSIFNGSSTSGAEVCVDALMDSVTTTIEPDATAAIWSIGVDNAGDEGATVQYTVSLSESFGAGESPTVDLALNDGDTNASDYASFVAAVNNAVAAYTGPGTLAFDGTSLTFTAGADGDAMTDLVIDLALTDDAIAEGTESFTVDLSNPTGPSGIAVAVDPLADGVITIINDTQGIGGVPDEVQFSISGPASGPEGTNVQYTVELTGALGAGEVASVQIDLGDIETTGSDYASFTAAVTAAAGADPNVSFNAATGVLNYTAPADGATMTPLVIDLGLSTDTIVEGDEDFEIVLSNAASSTGITVGIDALARDVITTITDATAPLEWRILGPAAEDEGGTAQYLILLDGSLGAGETATVQVSLNDLTTNTGDYASILAALSAAATANPDVVFDAATGELTYTSPADGAVMAPLVVDLGIVDDVLVEGPEQFEIALSNPGSTTGPAVQISPTANSVTTTINDNDTAIWSLTGVPTVAEGADAKYVLTLGGTLQAGETATIDLFIGNITAVATDFGSLATAVNDAIAAYTGSGSFAYDGTTLTFTSDGNPMGDLCIEVETIDDTLVEGNEDFQVSIANPGSASGSDVVTSSPTIVVTTITDNDEVIWSLTGDTVVDEGGTAQYTVALGGVLQAGETATVDLSLSDIETNSADYANFVTAVNAAVAGRSDLAFDGTTLTYTGDGNPMVDLVIELDAIDDTVIEGPERYQISLANSGSTTGSVSDINLAANLVSTTINDTVGDGGVLEEAVWSLGVNQTVPEGNPGAYLLELAGTLQADEVVTVDLNLADIDTIGSDYASFDAAVIAAVAAYPGPGSLAWDGTTLTFTSDGNPMAPLSISLGTVNDGFTEGVENFVIRLTNANSTTGAATSIDATADDAITTIDDTIGAGADDVTFAIVGDTTVDEGGTASYTVSTTGGLGAGQTATIEIDLADVNTNSADYANFSAAVSAAVAAYVGPGSVAWDGTTLTYTATVDGDQLTGFAVDLGAVDDAFLEGPEVYEVSLVNAGSTTGVVAGINALQNIVTTTINDTDGDGGPVEPGGEWSLVGGGLVDEGDPAGFTVVLDGSLQAGEVASVELSLSDTTTNNADYANFSAAVSAAVTAYNGNPANSGSLTWDGTNLSFTSDGSGPMDPLNISLATIDDAFTEGPESFDVSIANPGSTTGLSPSVSLTGNLVTTTIIDNDSSEFSIVGTPALSESSTASYTISLSGILQNGETANIDLSLTDTDTTSADYANFVAAVNSAVAGRSDLSFDGTTLTYTGDGNPMADLLVSLPAVDDLLTEGPEDYTISISNPASTTGSDIGTGTATSVTTTITDNDAVAFSLTGDTTVGEGANAGYVLSLAGTLQAGDTATIDLEFADVDTNSSDYSNFVTGVNAVIAGRSELAFDGTTLIYTGDGNPMDDLVIDLTAIDDLLTESTEDYTVSISNPGSTTGSSVVTDGTTAVTTSIIDNDTAIWNLTGDATVAEGGTASYSLALNGTLQSGETASIDLGLADVDTTSADYANFVAAVNVAIAGRSDLAFDGTTLTFTGDGNPFTPVIIHLTSTNDGFVEGDEDYTVAISSPASATVGVAVGTDFATTTIVDDDMATWELFGNLTVAEGATAQYNLFLSGTLQDGETASIDLTITDVDTNSTDYANFAAAVNSAIAGRSDLAFDGTTLTYTGDGTPFAALTIDILAIDDTLTEGVEDYQVSISNPASTTGGDVMLGAATSVTTTIVDNDDVIWSITGDTSVDEGGTAQYVVQLNGTLQAGDNSSVLLDLNDIETNSADYDNFVAAVQTAIGLRTDFSFDPATGVLTATGIGTPLPPLVINLDAINDTFVEGPERYQILLSTPTSTTGTASSIDPVNSLVSTTINDTNGDGGATDEAVWTLGIDQTVPEGSPAAYVLSLSNVLQNGEIATVDLGLTVIDTASSDTNLFSNAVNAAVAAYAGPGSLAWDGSTITFTADGTGPMAPLLISLGTVNDIFAEGPEDFVVELSNATSPTGSLVSIDGTQDDAVTTIDDTVGPGADDVTFALNGDTSVDEGGTATYSVTTTGGLGAGQSAAVDLNIGDVDTNASDYANFSATVLAAVTDYNAGGNPGTVGWDGTSLTFTANNDGDQLTGLVIDLGAVNDSLLEGPEVYQVQISNAFGSSGISAGVAASQALIVTTINDTDGDGGPAEPGAEWSLVGGGVITEGADAEYSIQLSGSLQDGENSSVQLNLIDIETNGGDYDLFATAIAMAVADYNADANNPGSLNWVGNVLTFTSDGTGLMNPLKISLGTVDDTLVESTERFNVLLANPTSTTGLTPTLNVPKNIATTTIIDNDLPEFSITGDTDTSEGNTAEYTVSLSGSFQAGETASVDIGLVDISTSSGDYGNLLAAIAAAAASDPDVSVDPNTGTITYTAPTDGTSMTDLTFDLPISSDGISEAPEDFVIALQNPSSNSGLSPTVDSSAQNVTTTINGSPVLQPDFLQTNIDQPIMGNLLSNDSDPDGDDLMVTQIDGQPIGSPIVTDCGTVEVNPDGSFVFTPNPGFFGVDTFTYTVVDSAGNTETSTVEILINNAQIGVAKAASDPIPNGENFDITFTLVVQNLGNVRLANVELIDDLAANFGDALVATSAPSVQNFSGIGTPPALNAGWSINTSQNLLDSVVLNPGEAFEVVFTVTVDPDADGAPGSLSNQATATGQGLNPDGSTLLDSEDNPIVASDVSDNGTNPNGENESEDGDGLFGNDPTEILIADLGIAKAIVGEPELLFSGNYVVTYQVVVKNTGTVNLGNLSLLEDLSTQFGSSFVDAGNLTLAVEPEDPASDIAVDSANFNGSTNIELMDSSSINRLAVGDSFVLEFTVEVNPQTISAPIGNQISGSGTAIDPSGTPLTDSTSKVIIGSDLSDSGTDPSSSNPEDPNDTGSTADSTFFDPPALPLGEITGSVFIDLNNNGVQEPGETGIENVEVTLTGMDVFGNAVDITVLTDVNGQYTFTGLNAGFYTLSQTQPEGFTDGIDAGESAWTIGDDQFSDIVLNWGQVFDASSFAERLTGASGTPPNLPGAGPLLNSPIGRLLSSYMTSSSPVYSGVPINSNANPLSLDSGREVSGGYSVAIDDGCECPIPIDTCEEPSTLFRSVSLIESEQCVTEPLDPCVDGIVPEDIVPECECDAELIEHSEAYDTQSADAMQVLDTCDKLRRPFLKRFTSWLGR